MQEDSSKCSIFSFDINANRSRLPLARNALRKFKTLRHPGVVKVLDTIEVREIAALDWKMDYSLPDTKLDRPADLYCNGTNNPAELGHEAESLVRRES